MKNKTLEYDALQSAYLLEYDRRRILNCADTFENLASVFAQMNREEAAEGKAAEKEADREAEWDKRRAQENRRHYASHMRQLAGMMQAVAGTSVQMIRLGGRRQKQIVRALAGEGIVVQDIFLLRGQEDKLEVSVSLCTKKDTSVTVEEIAGYLSVLLDLRLVPEKRNPYFVGKDLVNVYFEEEPEFCCMTAAATAIKESETVSGDSHSFLEQDDAMTLILSDGVGSGEIAAKDSARIVDLAEQILDAGLGERMASQILNSMVSSEGGELHMATLDLCRINLKNGECSFVKAGAASAFIKRGDQVERITADTLPLGMMAGAEEREITRQLSDGDLVILVSDGVLQDLPGTDGEFLFSQQIGRLHVSSPVDMANLLLRYVIGQCQGKIRDDMSILVAGIWENELSN